MALCMVHVQLMLGGKARDLSRSGTKQKTWRSSSCDRANTGPATPPAGFGLASGSSHSMSVGSARNPRSAMMAECTSLFA